MHDIVFFVDFDNTLLDNDGLKHDLELKVRECLGEESVGAFWAAYEDVRRDLGVIDFFETGRRLRELLPSEGARVDATVGAIMAWDFRPRLQPGALETLRHLGTLGLTMVISDGDAIFQPMKIWQSGVTSAVEGRVLIFGHKEERIADVAVRFPARRYVLIDDKPRVLAACKQVLGSRLTTVLVRFGHYAQEAGAGDGGADIAVDRIDQLQELTAADLAQPRAPRAAAAES